MIIYVVPLQNIKKIKKLKKLKIMETKVCSKCNKEKELFLFRNRKENKDGKGGVCKECECGHPPLKRYTKNTKQLKEKECLTCNQLLPIIEFDKTLTHGKYYYLSSCKKCRNMRNAELKRVTNFYRRKDLNRKYGLTIDNYNDMLEKQEEKCLICRIHIKNTSQGLYIDHCHITGKIRGLLCHQCNTGLGMFKDNIENLKAAIQYLQQNKE